MAVNIGSVIKYKMLAEHGQMPLLHGDYDFHPGAGMHIGAAWTIMFNIVNSMVNVCNDGDIGLEHLHPSSIRGEDEREQKEPTHDVHAEEYNTENIIKGNVTSTANSSTTPMMVIDPDLVSNVEKGEPPFQQIGRMKEGYMEDSHKNTRLELEENIRTTKAFCDDGKLRMGAEYVRKCSYAWIFGDPETLKKEMKKILLHTDGWTVGGYPIRQRTGWYTHTPNATFSIIIRDLPIDTKVLTILSMKSYSGKWRDSKLAVSTTIVPPKNETTLLTTEGNKFDWEAAESSDIYYIDGYQDTKTSVHFKHKIPISGGVAIAGDSIIMNAKLVGGQEFKIAGLAFCAF